MDSLEMRQMIHLQLAVLSGVAASLASVFAKLAADTGTNGGLIYTLACSWLTGLDCSVAGVSEQPEFVQVAYSSHLETV